MTKGNYPYPEDEFDADPGPDAPIGVHRAPRTWWSRWWPFVAVIVVVPALTIAAVIWASSWNGLEGAGTDATLSEVADDATATDEVTEPATTDAPAEDTTGAEDTAPTEDTPAATVNYAQAIDVLNAAGRSGLAADVADQLSTAGFTGATAGNGDSSLADTTTVFYASADLQATAEAVADALGITTVTESADNAGSGVTVLLRSDFSG